MVYKDYQQESQLPPPQKPPIKHNSRHTRPPKIPNKPLPQLPNKRLRLRRTLEKRITPVITLVVHVVFIIELIVRVVAVVACTVDEGCAWGSSGGEAVGADVCGGTDAAGAGVGAAGG